MSQLVILDDMVPNTGHCNLCGRYFDINEVQVGVFVHYFLLYRDACPCPTCFGHQLHRVNDPNLDDVLTSLQFCDTPPSRVIARASVWRAAPNSKEN